MLLAPWWCGTIMAAKPVSEWPVIWTRAIAVCIALIVWSSAILTAELWVGIVAATGRAIAIVSRTVMKRKIDIFSGLFWDSSFILGKHWKSVVMLASIYWWGRGWKLTCGFRSQVTASPRLRHTWKLHVGFVVEEIFRFSYWCSASLVLHHTVLEQLAITTSCIWINAEVKVLLERFADHALANVPN